MKAAIVDPTRNVRHSARGPLGGHSPLDRLDWLAMRHAASLHAGTIEFEADQEFHDAAHAHVKASPHAEFVTAKPDHGRLASYKNIPIKVVD